MADEKLYADRRHEFGKGSARKLRREGRVPAVVYGRGRRPSHISFDAHEIFLAIKGHANAVLNVDIEGIDLFALVKDIQRHPIRRTIEHIDLWRVTEEDKVEVEVPVEVVGESFSGTIHTIEMMHLLVQAPVIAIPESIVVDVEGMQNGEHVTVADLKLPPNVVCELDPEAIVVGISIPAVERVVVETEEEAEEATEGKSEEKEEKGEDE